MDSSHIEWWKPWEGDYFYIWMQCIAGAFYTFLNHQFIFPLISHLKRPTKKRVDRIFVVCHIEEYIVYSIIGLMGYFLLSQHIDTIPIAALVVTSISTLPLFLAKMSLCVANFLAFPLQIFAAR
jgi:amino acid permease